MGKAKEKDVQTALAAGRMFGRQVLLGDRGHPETEATSREVRAEALRRLERERPRR